MSKKNEKDKLIDIAAKVLSIQPTILKQALENALDISILQREIQMLRDLINQQQQQHDNEIKELKRQLKR